MLKGLNENGKSESWFLYILECNDGTLYTGITNDITRRLQQHNDGKGARYTRTRCPVKLLYYEPCRNRAAAMVRECAVKSLPRERKMKIVRSHSARYAAPCSGVRFGDKSP